MGAASGHHNCGNNYNIYIILNASNPDVSSLNLPALKDLALHPRPSLVILSISALLWEFRTHVYHGRSVLITVALLQLALRSSRSLLGNSSKAIPLTQNYIS
jgi:hypothetical protein